MKYAESFLCYSLNKKKVLYLNITKSKVATTNQQPLPIN